MMQRYVLAMVLASLLPEMSFGAIVYSTAGDESFNDAIAGNRYAAYGDEVTLGGTARLVTSVQIPFMLFNASDFPATAYTPDLTLLLMRNDGSLDLPGDAGGMDDTPGNEFRPGSVIASSHVIGPTFQPLAPNNDVENISFPFPDVLVPNHFSLMVYQNTPDGSPGANQFDVLLSDVGGANGVPHPELVGSNGGYVWVYNLLSNSFETTDFGGLNIALEAKITATTAPEPPGGALAFTAATLMALSCLRSRVYGSTVRTVFEF